MKAQDNYIRQDAQAVERPQNLMLGTHHQGRCAEVSGPVALVELLL